MTSAYPPIARLMPHGLPLRALEALLHWDERGAVCQVTIRDDMPFVRDGRIASIITLEYMAQAVAVCLGHEAFLAGQGLRVGMIIGVRKLEIVVPFIDAGTELRIEVGRDRGNDEVSTFRGTTKAGETVISLASMTIYHGARPTAA